MKQGSESSSHWLPTNETSDDSRRLCIHRVPFQRDRILGRFIPQKRITIPNAFEEAFVISSGTCSFIKISRSVFAILFLPMNSLLSLEYVPFNRCLRTTYNVHGAVRPCIFPCYIVPFLVWPGFNVSINSSKSKDKNFLGEWAFAWKDKRRRFKEHMRNLFVNRRDLIARRLQRCYLLSSFWKSNIRETWWALAFYLNETLQQCVVFCTNNILKRMNFFNPVKIPIIRADNESAIYALLGHIFLLFLSRIR